MSRIKLSILIPSFARPKVLNETLTSLVNLSYGYGMDVRIEVGTMGDFESYEVVNSAREFARKRVAFIYSLSDVDMQYNDVWHVHYPWNIGKAQCLNDMIQNHGDADYILTMDNDMVVRRPWLHILRAAIDSQYIYGNFDICGFGSSEYFIHIPMSKDECPHEAFFINDHIYDICYPLSLGGGMMLFHTDYLMEHAFDSYGGGVYLGEDDLMSKTTANKRIIYYDEPWVEHDPFGDILYPEYAKQKIDLYNSGTRVYERDWYKDA